MQLPDFTTAVRLGRAMHNRAADPRIPNHVLSSAERRVRAGAAGRAAPVTPPMVHWSFATSIRDRRIDAYRRQTGRWSLTPRQRRRVIHKLNHGKAPF